MSYIYMITSLLKFFYPSFPSFNHKTDGEHVHFTSTSDDSDSEDHKEQSDASDDDQSTIENPMNSPSGYIHNMCVCHWILSRFPMD